MNTGRDPVTNSNKLHVLVIGDGAGLTTGFAQVIQHCVKVFVAQGWDVHQVTSLDNGKTTRDAYRLLGITPWFVDGVDQFGNGDMTGLIHTLPRALRAVRPNVIFMNADPGMAVNWYTQLDRLNASSIPLVFYGPVEGAPICEGYVYAFARATRAITCTQWGTDQLKDEYNIDIPWVYHGVDRDVWHPLSEDVKRRIRKDIGWEGRFVVSYVARNSGRKSHDRLLKAISMLVNEGLGPDIPPRKDYLLYLHCRDFDNNWNGGWDLGWISRKLGLDDHVRFASSAFAATRGEALASLTKKLACSDLYVSPSKVEGFGLPLVEAMASGLPVIIPADRGNQEEVVGKETALARLEPSDWETWFNGAQLACVDPTHIAMAIHYARDNARLRAVAASRSLARAQVFSWGIMTDKLVTLVKEAAELKIDNPDARLHSLAKPVRDDTAV